MLAPETFKAAMGRKNYIYIIDTGCYKRTSFEPSLLKKNDKLLKKYM